MLCRKCKPEWRDMIISWVPCKYSCLCISCSWFLGYSNSRSVTASRWERGRCAIYSNSFFFLLREQNGCSTLLSPLIFISSTLFSRSGALEIANETIFQWSVNRRDSHERVVDEGASSRPLQHVVEAVLDLAVTLAGGGRGGSGSGGSGIRSSQQAGALWRLRALRTRRLGVHSRQRHELHAPVVGRGGSEHPHTAVIGRATQHAFCSQDNALEWISTLIQKRHKCRCLIR